MTEFINILPIKHIDFMIELISRITSEEALLSLEGDLSNVNVEDIKDTSTEEYGLHKRNSSFTTDKFIVIPLNSFNRNILSTKIFYSIGLRKNIWHILISLDNKLLFYSYDCFYDGCYLTNSIEWRHSFMSDMRDLKIIR